MFGNNTKTGNLFLVNVEDGTILTATKDTMGNIIPGEMVDPLLLVQIVTEENNQDGENIGD